MKRVSGLLGSFLLAAALLLPGAASAKPFSKLIIISGSLSDVGNYASVHGWFGPPFYNNRSTNGPNLDDYFAETLGFPNEPSLHLIGPAVGNNFAVFQSLAGGNGPEDLPAQIKAYLDSQGGRADPDALHLLLISGTDVINALLQPDDRVASKIIDDCVTGQETALRRLVAHGAKTIYAPSFTDLGLTPYAIKNNVVRRATRISEEYDRKYNAMLDRVERDRRLKFELVRWDFLGYSRQLLGHFEEFGFTNYKDSCIDFIPTGQCNLDKFAFLADFFPTTRLHRLFAIAMAQNLIDRDENRCSRFNGRFDKGSRKCRGNDGVSDLFEGWAGR